MMKRVAAQSLKVSRSDSVLSGASIRVVFVAPWRMLTDIIFADGSSVGRDRFYVALQLPFEPARFFTFQD